MYRGRQLEATPVKIFPRKVTMERILSIVISEAQLSRALEEEEDILCICLFSSSKQQSP